MSDFLNDTPMVGRVVCPTCEPEADPLTEVLDTRYCHRHEPARHGDADAEVTQGWISGTAESGEDNAKWCDAIHRKIVPAS